MIEIIEFEDDYINKFETVNDYINECGLDAANEALHEAQGCYL